MTDPIITLRGLEKHFGDVRALDGVTADIPRGAVGLLGPNGSGKTTLIKLLLGLLKPTGGEALVAGFNPRKRADRLAVRRVVGYMPEGDCLMPGMTGVDLVATLGRITGMSKQDAMTRAHEALNYVELEEARYRGLDEYSTGMKQRLKLAQALVHDPDILLLDEPTNGLDPKGRRHMLELVHDLGHAQGKNILLCSHLLPDVEKTCDRIVVLNRGQVAAEGAIEEMTRSDGLLLSARVEGETERFTAALREAGYGCESGELGTLTIQLDGRAEDADPIFAIAARVGASVTALAPVRSTLEQVFLQAVNEHEQAGKTASA
ncbi:MAG: ABC transporter ATP-binding protein [Planctomycetota bacterium]|nr:MAG: ABC transporter ATP-binding protein [Planctomycetota bacterium]